MKEILYLFAVAGALFFSSAHSAESPSWEPIPKNRQQYFLGGILAAFKKGDRQCFYYPKHIIIEEGLKKSVGSDIFLFEVADPNPRNAGQCERDLSKASWTLKNEWAEYFQGLDEDFLFLDSGTSASSRGLLIYSIKNRKKVQTINHDADGFKLRGDKLLHLNAILGKKMIGSSPVPKECSGPLVTDPGVVSLAPVGTIAIDLKTWAEELEGDIKCQERLVGGE